MNKTYSRIHWVNLPTKTTPLSAVNLNKMDDAIDEIDDRVVSMDNTKADKSDLNSLVKNVAYNESTGVIKFTYYNNTTFEVDINVEKIPASFYMDNNAVIHLYGADGTEIGKADLSKIVGNVTFADSDTVKFTSTTKTDGGKEYKAEVVDGSITKEKLDAEYLSDINTAINRTKALADKIKNTSFYIDFTTGHLMYTDGVTAEYGLFDEDDNLLEAWDDLYVDLSTDYTSVDKALEDINSLMYMITNTYPDTKIIRIPNTVTVIGDYQIDASNLIGLQIPTSLTSIGNKNLANYINEDADIILNDCTSIGKLLFSNSKLKSLELPNVTSIPDEAFSNANIPHVVLNDNITEWGSYALYGAKLPDFDFHITTTNVHNIGGVLGDSVLYSNMEKLNHIIFDKDTQNDYVTALFYRHLMLNDMQYGPFEDDDPTKLIDARYLTVGPIGNTADSYIQFGWDEIIPQNAFYSMKMYYFKEGYVNSYYIPVNFIIPEGIKTIGPQSFRECQNLFTLNLPSTIITLGSSAFMGCDNLSSIVFPTNCSLTKIVNYCFSGCVKLTSVTLPNKLTTIGQSAFYGCSNIEELVVPDSVTTIGGSAFYKVKHITYHGTATGSPWGALSIN